MLSEEDVIAKLRAELVGTQLTQQEFALRIGCDPGQLSKILNGILSPTGSVLAHMRLQAIRVYVPYGWDRLPLIVPEA